MTHDGVLPLVQNLARAHAARGDDEIPVLGLVNGAYGVWSEAVAVDPSGGFVGETLKAGALSAAIFGGVGYLVPGLTVVEGLKWGFIIGASRSIFNRFRSRP